MNQRYCNTVVIREKISTTDVELLSISLRPFYLPCEFQQLFYTLVYIHPRADASAAAQLISGITHKLDSICPEAPKFFLGDFNHCNLKKTLRTYEQYVTYSTAHKNTILDLCYGSVSGAHKSLPMPFYGASYHSSVYLMPVYKRSLRCLEQEERTVKIWSKNSISSLQACFECTDWHCFYDGCDDINDLSDIISSYITFCVDLVIPTKKVVTYPNNKPWVTKELKAVINKKKRIFYSGDPLAKKTASREVKVEIRKAKMKYKNKIESQNCSGVLRAAWRGIKSMPSINQSSCETIQAIHVNGVDDDNLANCFNSFFSWFEDLIF